LEEAFLDRFAADAEKMKEMTAPSPIETPRIA
jgi:hypothetical protein